MPAKFNLATAGCGRWAQESSRIALHGDNKTGASHSFTALQADTNRLSNALAALGVARGDRAAIVDTSLAPTRIALRDGLPELKPPDHD
ncbi:MAG: hypothetical protein RR101_15205 [Burkholderiaceae bacterium]